MTIAANFFAKVFGLDYIPVEYESEYYYFEQVVDEYGTKNSFQIRKIKIDTFARSLGPDAGFPGPFITGISGNVEDGFPEHLIVVPSMGADVVSMYHRDGLAG